MNIVMLSSEAAPYIKTGGLGDVLEGLPAELTRLGHRVTVFLPYHKAIACPGKLLQSVTVHLGWRQQYCGILKAPERADRVQVFFIDNLYYFGRESLYGHPDDGERFAFFSKACLEALKVLSIVPDILHCHDWHTAPAAVYLAAEYHKSFPNTRCLLTIHNIQYQGWEKSTFFDDVLGLPEKFRPLLDMHGSVNLLKGGIEAAHHITTVSRTYAGELRGAAHGCGLEKLLEANAHKLTGITNGIDTRVFDPATDPDLPANFSAENFREQKPRCKAALQEALGLPIRAAAPLLCMVSRLAEHKGVSLLEDIAPKLLEQQDCQLCILGTGEQRFENFLKDLQRRYPHKVAVRLGFHLALASQIYGGGDLYLMPSKSEPCGLSQMNAMRYGTVPVVHATGGLRDTVPGADDRGQGGLGFTFQSYDPEDFYYAIVRALRLYETNPTAFQSLQYRCLTQDFSWHTPAKQYEKLFQIIT